MSLSSILDDIQGGFSKENPGTPEDAYQSEEIEATPVAADSLASLEVIKEKTAKFVQHQYITGVFKNALEEETMGKSTAMELFTMLPSPESKQLPVLTQAPTVHNKRQMLDIFNRYNEEVVIDKAIRDEVTSLIKNSADVWEDTHHACEFYEKEIKQHLKRLESCPSIVIYKGKSINLLTTDIGEVASIDSFSLDYKPYEGVLENNFMRIKNDKNLQEFLQSNTMLRGESLNPTLEEVARHLLALIYSEAGHHTAIHRLYGDANRVTETDLSTAVKALDWYRKFSTVFTGTDALADKVVKCGLCFLA